LLCQHGPPQFYAAIA
jgi:hypothetical protein